jgi:multicomponent Na+:H+ antiporter subunit D
MTPEIAIIFAVVIPLLGGVLMALHDRYPNLRETITIGTAVCLFLVVLSLLPAVSGGERPGFVLVHILPTLPIAFEVEPLGMMFAMIASGLWIVTSFYSIGYMRAHNEQKQTRFYICFAIALSATMGISFAGNMLTLFIFYEVLTLSTYPLVTHHEDEDAIKGGRVYLGILISTSIGFMLFAMIWTWLIAGTLDFTDGGILAGRAEGPMVAILLFLYMYGIGKAALMPIHRWLPSAMVAPTPVSALLHAVAVVKAGVFTVIKVLTYIFGTDLLSGMTQTQWLSWIAAFTMLTASVIALTKDNLKARLAYSTVSQLSYIVLGASLATGLGIVASGMHIAMHAFGKITLFFCAGAIMVAAHKTEISEMDGLGRTMPFTYTAFFIGSLCVIGLPPMGGAWSKLYLMMAAADAGQLVLVGVYMVSTLLAIGYLLPVVVRGFLRAPPPAPAHAGAAAAPGAHGHGHGTGIREAPGFCLFAIAISSLGCIVLFFQADALFDLLSMIFEN